MYTVRVNNDTFEIESSGDEYMVNGKQVDFDLSRVSTDYFHILLGTRSYRAEIVEADSATKRYTIKVNGKHYPVVMKDKFDMLLEKMGMNATAGARVNHVTAPMPGLIIDLKVKEGDVVKAGDTLLILEAMKMQIRVNAPDAGRVRRLLVGKGALVERGQVLAEIET